MHEKGGKFHEVPAHPNAEQYLDDYVRASGIGDDRKLPLFRGALGSMGRRTAVRMARTDILRMVNCRGAAAGIDTDRICCHTFRATGINAYLDNGGTIEHFRAIAAHESPRTTKLYDRTDQTLTLDEIDRIAI